MKPIKVDDVSLVLGGDVTHLMPEYKNIPDEFKRYKGNIFVDFVSNWFFKGISKENLGRLIPKENIDTNMALRHIKAVLGSWSPKHEHKIAGCAYLLSEFFTLES